MTKEELVSRLRDIEWDDFEVKAAKAELPKNVWESVCAFANGSGGWIVLGVKQTGKKFEITGVDDIGKLEQDFLSCLRTKKFNVRLSAKATRHQIDGKDILCFYIPSHETKPVYIGTPENTFIRMGSGDQHATQQEVMALFRDQTFGVKSQQSIPATSIKMLNGDSLADFRGEVRYVGLVKHLDNVSDEQFCRAVGITDERGNLTYGGLIMFGKNPYTFRYVPTFCADYVEIPGTGTEAYTNRYTYRIPEQENLWDAAKIILRRIRTLVNTPMTGINLKGQSEEDLSEYNILREALVNQMAHADHFSPQRSCIHVFDDRIEFINPGGMPKPIEAMEKAFDSMPRNPVISKLFRLAKFSENLGYGLRKLKSWNVVTGNEMQIESTFTSVKVIFGLKRNIERQVANAGNLESAPKSTLQSAQNNVKQKIIKNKNNSILQSTQNNVTQKNTKRKNNSVLQSTLESSPKSAPKSEFEILSQLRKNPKMTLTDVATNTGLSRSWVAKTIKRLQENNVVKRVGSDKTGYWKVLDEEEN